MDEPKTSSADVSKVEAILAKVEPAYAMRLRGLYNKWLNPEENSLKETEKRELISAKIIPESFAVAEVGQALPKLVSQRSLAKILGETFKVIVVQRQVQEEMKKGRLNGGTGLAMYEVAGGSGSIQCAPAVQWWKENKIFPQAQNPSNPHIEESKARKLAAEAAMAERENERQRRKYDAEWMLSSAHEFAMSAVGTAAVTTVKDTIERKARQTIEDTIKRIVTDLALQQSLLNELRPLFSEATDQWQTDFCNRLAELNTESKTNSERQKGELR